MKSFIVALCVAVAGATSLSLPFDAEAKRLGGGRPAGLQRSVPQKAPQSPPPQQPAQPGNAAAPTQGAAPATPAQAPRRSWMGPLAGLAAGLGIAALMSHLGLGAAFGNLLTGLLLAVAAFFLLRWVMRRFAGSSAAPSLHGGHGAQLAGAGAPFGGHGGAQGQGNGPASGAPVLHRDALGRQALAQVLSSGSPSAAHAVPPGFDAAEFQRVAKMIFIRLQAANDEGNVEDLRKFTTPELFASLRLDLQERAGSAQQTDVMQLDAEVVDTAQEDGQWVVTVRFHGLIREVADAGAQPFNELWHLVRPLDERREWAIAGITPLPA